LMLLFFEKLASKVFFAFLGVVFLAGISGCGEKYPDGMPKLTKVSLTFTQEGKPLAGATVSLFSDDPTFKWAVGGTTDNNGIVVLKTHGIYTGAPEGTYMICVNKYVSEGEPPTIDNPNVPPPRNYNLVESHYSNRRETTLSMEIKSGSKYEPFDVGPAVKEQLKAPGM